MTTWLKITAKFAGKCCFCKRQIPAGDEVLWDRENSVIAHPDCKRQHEQRAEVPVPSTRLDLWPHQRDAYSFAYHRRGTLLAMDMGTGKTAVVSALLDTWACRRVLVFGPRAVLPVWPSQMQKHSDRDWICAAPTGTIDERIEQLLALAAEPGPWMFVVNYDLVGTGLGNAEDERPDLRRRIADLERRGDADELARARRSLAGMDAAWTRREGMQRLTTVMKQLDLDALVLDECHRIKSPGSQQSLFIRGLAEQVPRVLGLTGTPMPKGPEDIYAQMRAIDPSVFGTSFKRFKSKFCIMGGYEDRQIVAYRNKDEFADLLSTCAVRCKIDDVIDLPDAVDTTVPVPLSEREARVHTELSELMVAGLEDGTITTFNGLTKLLRLQQVTGGWAQLDDEEAPREVGTAKRDVLRELIEDMPTEEPVVVFCRFTTDLRNVKTVAAELGRPVDELSGHRKDIGAVWEPRTGAVAAVQISAGSMGIDLTAARYAVYYSMGFSLGDYMQSRARLRRKGQQRAVWYYHLVGRMEADGTGETVDDLVLAAIERKGDVVDEVLSALRA